MKSGSMPLPCYLAISFGQWCVKGYFCILSKMTVTPWGNVVVKKGWLLIWGLRNVFNMDYKWNECVDMEYDIWHRKKKAS